MHKCRAWWSRAEEQSFVSIHDVLPVPGDTHPTPGLGVQEGPSSSADEHAEHANPHAEVWGAS